MTEWADIADLYRSWRESPPVHELVAMAVQFKPAPGSQSEGEGATLATSGEMMTAFKAMQAAFSVSEKQGMA